MFEVHCSNISKDFLYFVICLPLEPLMTSPVFWQKLEYLPNVRQYFKNENTILFFVLKALQISFIFFHFIGTLIINVWQHDLIFYNILNNTS